MKLLKKFKKSGVTHNKAIVEALGPIKMRQIYTLKQELEDEPDQIVKVQALTKDTSKSFGLKGSYGLFGSDEWWESISSGKAVTKLYEGKIDRLYTEGMESDSQAFVVTLKTGGEYKYSCVADNEEDLNAYKVGNYISVTVVEEILKSGGVSEIVLEVLVDA